MEGEEFEKKEELAGKENLKIVKVPPIEGEPSLVRVATEEGKEGVYDGSENREGQDEKKSGAGIAIAIGILAILAIGICAFIYFRKRTGAKEGQASPGQP